MSLIELLNQKLDRDNDWPGGWNTFWFLVCSDIGMRGTQQAKRLLNQLHSIKPSVDIEDWIKDTRDEFKRSFTG